MEEKKDKLKDRQSKPSAMEIKKLAFGYILILVLLGIGLYIGFKTATKTNQNPNETNDTKTESVSENSKPSPSRSEKSTELVSSHFQVGDYIQFGTYLGKHILWKCEKEDSNGYLLVSEYILCLKAYDAAENGAADPTIAVEEYSSDTMGSNVWSNSNIREWLNSKDSIVSYSTQKPNSESILYGHNPYDTEPGFLSNFSNSEIAKIQTCKNDDATDKVFNW